MRIARRSVRPGRAAEHVCDHAPMTLPTEPGDPTEPADAPETCAICGRELWSDGLPPARDGDAWICGDCDAARNFAVLDL